MNLDCSVFRGFPLGGTRRIEFRLRGGQPHQHAEVFNPPNGDVTSGDFMRITGLQSGYDSARSDWDVRFQF